jgi:hypothetical protein
VGSILLFVRGCKPLVCSSAAPNFFPSKRLVLRGPGSNTLVHEIGLVLQPSPQRRSAWATCPTTYEETSSLRIYVVGLPDEHDDREYCTILLSRWSCYVLTCRTPATPGAGRCTAASADGRQMAERAWLWGCREREMNRNLAISPPRHACMNHQVERLHGN